MFASLFANTLKEWKLLLRDPHGLAILFLMPVVFAVVMSVALRDFLGDGGSRAFDLVVADADRGQVAADIIDALRALGTFDVKVLPDASAADLAELRERRQAFGLILPAGSSARYAQVQASGDADRIINAQPADRIELEWLVDPTLRADARALAQAAVERALFGVEIERVYIRFSGRLIDPQRGRGLLGLAGATQPAAAAASTMPRASSTQQNVPAYALLAMFMIVIPLSSAFIRERAQGTLLRLRSMPVPAVAIVGGKILPFLAINFAQMALCFAIGRFALARLGAPALTMPDAWAALTVLVLCASLAAIGFALAVAMFARTVEQATAFGATVVLLAAALGGVMVPKLMMPAALQQVAALSPIGWALDAMLELFVRNAGFARIAPDAAALLAVAALCLGLAIWRYRRAAASGFAP